MGLMNSIGIVVAKLLNDPLDPLEFLICNKIPDGTLEAVEDVRYNGEFRISILL